jgi:hypothetical protein
MTSTNPLKFQRGTAEKHSKVNNNLTSTKHLILNIQILWPNLLQYWQLRHATSRKVAGLIPDEIIGFFNWPNPSSRTMALGSTQPLTEMSTKNLPGRKGRSVRESDNVTAICKTIV